MTEIDIRYRPENEIVKYRFFEQLEHMNNGKDEKSKSPTECRAFTMTKEINNADNFILYVKYITVNHFSFLCRRNVFR